MANGLWVTLRGARRIELFAALALAALLALALMDLGGDRGGDKTALEARVERILEQVDGVGRVSAMITQGPDEAVTGVVIVASGLRDVKTYLCLQRAVTALLDATPEAIEIIGSDGAFGGAT